MPMICEVCGQKNHNARAHQQPVQPVVVQQAPGQQPTVMYAAAQPRRSAMWTTLVVLFTIFVLVPLIVMGGCAVLGIVGYGMSGT